MTVRGRRLARIDYSLIRAGDPPSFAIRRSNDPFVCILIARYGLDGPGMMALARSALDAGCVAMCAWGEAASGWDDAFDLADIERCDGVPEHVTMTTWHDGERMDEFLHYATRVAHPAADDLACDRGHIVELGPADRWADYAAILAAQEDGPPNARSDGITSLREGAERWPA